MNENGFTLIEIIIAVTITGIILGAVFMFLHQGLFTWENIDDNGEWEQNWRVFDKRFKDDMHNFYYSQLYKKNLFEGKNQSIRFLINEDGVLKEVSYTLNDYYNTIVREVKPCPAVDNLYSETYTPQSNSTGDSSKKEEKLNFFKDFEYYRVSYEYFDQQKKVWSPLWIEDYLPSLVKVNIDSVDNNEMMALPSILAEIRISREYERGVIINE